MGAGQTFIAAMKQKAIDCGMTTEPTVSQALSDGTAFILLDMRTAAGSKAALGGTYPATSLYMPTDWVDENKATVQKLVNAYVSTLTWIHGHSAAEIADKMPADYYKGVGKAAYVAALNSEKGIFNPTGVMPADGPKTCLAVLGRVQPQGAGQVDRPGQDLHQRVRPGGHSGQLTRTAEAVATDGALGPARATGRPQRRRSLPCVRSSGHGTGPAQPEGPPGTSR